MIDENKKENSQIKSIEAQILLWISSFFLLSIKEKDDILSEVSTAVNRTLECLNPNRNKYCKDENGKTVFNIYHSNQLSIFLYYLSNNLYKKNLEHLAEKIYLLNKSLNCCDFFYQVELPDIFYCEHPLGSVMGRGRFSNYFIFQQNCTIGGNKGCYPILGEYVWMFAGATVIGKTVIGNNVFISAGSYIKDEIIPDHSLVFGRSPDLVIKEKGIEYFRDKFIF